MTSENEIKDLPPVCDYEGSDYQDRFWGDGQRDYEDQAEAVALKRMLPKHGKLMLEVGAGAGRNTPRYAGYERIVVSDFSVTQLQQAQAFLGRDKKYIYVAADVYKLPFVSSLFDGATMIRVLHHMADGQLALRKIQETLQSDATFILEYANKQNLKAILRFWLKKQSWNPFTLDPIEFEPLNFDFHPKAIRQWLSDLLFDRKQQLTVSHFRIPILKRLIPTSILVWMDSIAQWTGDWWQLTPSVFVKLIFVESRENASPDHFFKCPTCNSPLVDNNPDYVACDCGEKWPIQDGIYNFKESIK
jgi:ubiquinone/menaquinone biosynthesis C-methylase UbiE